MGKRKMGKETTKQTLTPPPAKNGEINEEEEEAEQEKGGRFFACYLLTSLCPRFKGHTYIGFTVNPRRRIRQHNGEIGSGAWRTKRKRPWEMVFCIYGFPTNVAALQFEWAWQHPVKSLAVREAAASFKSRSGLANKIKLTYTMLTLPAWHSLNLTVNFFSTKYQKHISGCPTLPEQMRTQVRSMDELPCYNGDYTCANDEWDGDDEQCELSDGFHESTQVVGCSSINHGSSEENVGVKKNQKDESSCESSGYSEKDSPVRAFSFVTSLFDIAGHVEKEQRFGDPSMKRPKTATVAHNDQSLLERPCIRPEVEVIDIVTPSPCNAVNSRNKKRRPTYPEIIDLTLSPMFV